MHLKENHSYYKMCWLGYNINRRSQVTKKGIEENAPEVLAISKNTLANAAKGVLKLKK